MTRGYLSTSTFIIALSITLVMFVGMGLQILHQYRVAKTVGSQNSRLQGLSGIITHLGEVLTMSARMGAATGDLKWEERYLGFEPQLDKTWNESRCNVRLRYQHTRLFL